MPVQAVPDRYDVIAIRHQPLTAEIPVIRRVHGMLRYAPRQLMHFYTDLRPGATRLWRDVVENALHRRPEGSNYEKFCGGELRWLIYKTPDDMVTFHKQARAIARKTYQERLFDSGLPDTVAFRDQMSELARRDLVRGFLLFHGENPVAYLYTPAPDDGFLVYEYFSGYDPVYSPSFSWNSVCSIWH